MLHIAICDDQYDQIKMIRSAAEQYIARLDIKAVITEYGNAMEFLESLNRSGGFDILLLDICMPGFLGTQVAKEVRGRKDKTEIIFLTTSNEFAVDAFALKAAHYLLKPISQNQFDEAMDRATERFLGDQVKTISVKLENGSVLLVDINDILYLESSGHTQCIYLGDGTCKNARLSLARLAQELEEASPGQFINPYKGYLVNQRAIRAIEPKQIILHCGTRLPLPRGGFRQLQEVFFEYHFREGGTR